MHSSYSLVCKEWHRKAFNYVTELQIVTSGSHTAENPSERDSPISMNQLQWIHQTAIPPYCNVPKLLSQQYHLTEFQIYRPSLKEMPLDLLMDICNALPSTVTRLWLWLFSQEEFAREGGSLDLINDGTDEDFRKDVYLSLLNCVVARCPNIEIIMFNCPYAAVATCTFLLFHLYRPY